MKKTILFVATVFLAFQGFSQKEFNSVDGGSSGAANSNFDIYSRTIDIDQKALSFGLTEVEFNLIKDKAYANSNFIVGNIYQDDKLLKSNIPMRYNAYADEVEIKNHASEKNYGALTKDPSIYVKIAKDNYVFVPYENSNEKGGYFSVLADGKKYGLYKKTSVVFKEPRKAQNNYQKDIPADFEKTVTYYLVKDGKFLEMPKKKSQMIKAMDTKTSQVKDYAKENNLDVDKEEDLIKVFNYFDSLQ